tara:strand:- start:379 stop:1029 length:651 start_codon:yes stop_codon:yes gene_type:complete
LFFSRIRALFFPHPSPATDLPRRSPSTDSKTFKKPRRPFEKERLDSELKIVGEYGLRNKRELWRVQFALNKLRNAARVLLTLDEKDPKRIFEGEAIMRRMYRYGLLVRSRFPFDNHFDFWIFGGEHEASASLGPVCRPLASRGIGLGSGARTLKIAEKKFASLTATQPHSPSLNRTSPRTSSITCSRSPPRFSSSAVSRPSCSSSASQSLFTTRVC